MRKEKILSVMCIMIAMLLLAPSATAKDYFESWDDGDEFELTGHTFSEEYWTSEVTNTTDGGDNVTFSVSYINNSGVEVFYVALDNVEGPNGKGAMPYQTLGIHYFTPEGREVFISATFAFLTVFNDTNSNNVPDDGEDQYIVQPFGLGNDSWVPTTTVMPVQKVADGHYRFGIKYENMYGGIFVGLVPWFVAKFSEFTITYDIKFDDSGEVDIKTSYTLGQVTECHLFLIFPVEPSEVITDEMTIAAVHYVSVFTSKYRVTNQVGSEIVKTQPSGPVEEITVDVGDNKERAFKISSEGKFDLLNESTSPPTLVADDADAYNVLVKTTLLETIAIALFNPLFGASVAVSARVTALFGYALSENAQETYSSPADMAQKALNPFNAQGFGKVAFWYAVAFPSWNGYRVEYDPTYTAYFDPSGISSAVDEKVPGFEPFLLLTSIIAMALVLRRRRLA